MIGLAVTLLIILVAIFADVIWDYQTDVIGMNIPQDVYKRQLKGTTG